MNIVKFRQPLYENGKFVRFAYWGRDVEGAKFASPMQQADCDVYDIKDDDQCTGLKDKNGVLVYEGDIIVDKYGKKGYIKFTKNAMFQCYIKNGTGKCSFITSYSLEAGYMKNSEVIGNIHANQDLLD